MLVSPGTSTKERQKAVLRELLPRWLASAPLYAARGALPPGDPLEQLDRLPPITKEDIRRDFPRNFLPPGVELETLIEEGLVEVEHTAGTSDERTPLVLPRHWWAEQERRALALNPVTALAARAESPLRRVTIASPACSGEISYHGVPSCQERTLGATRYASLSRYPFLWSEADLARIADEALAWDPVFLDVDPVYGAVFARYCERRGVEFPRLRFVLCSYELPSVAHRELLRRVFKVPVVNLYGSTETGHLLIDAEDGWMRPSLDTAWLELTHAQSGVGDLLATTLTNPYMPLIRYRLGDLAERAASGEDFLYRVHGRIRDAFHLADGRRITTWQIDQCFVGTTGFAHYQLAQTAPAEWRLRYVPDNAGPAEETVRSVRERLADTLEAPGGIPAQAADAVGPETSGKFRLTRPWRAPS